jgi:hypothetical protein
MRNQVQALVITLFLITMAVSSSAQAQVIIGVDDLIPVPTIQYLEMESPGILDNDLLDDESAFEMGAHAELVTDASEGTLTLNADGSFTYLPDATFDGTDHFVYAVVFGSVSAEATVTLTACDGGPDVFACWKEQAFLDMAAQYGYYPSIESFEDDAWAAVRAPNSALSVANMGVSWSTNYADAPHFYPITTGSGAAYRGQWGAYDPLHGYAEGTPGICDVDNPPEICREKDGLSGQVITGAPPLVGIGGYFSGIYGAKVDIIIDDAIQYPGVHVYDYQFFGVLDTRPTGFNRFSFEEQDGKIGQSFYIWGDYFTLLRTEPQVSATPANQAQFFFAGASPNPAGSSGTVWRFSLPTASDVSLNMYDMRGRLVKELVTETMSAGQQTVSWDGRDSSDRKVSAGTYFGKLRAGSNGQYGESVRKVIILH